MKIFLMGANGFIGSHLTERILSRTEYELTAFDIRSDNLERFKPSHDRFRLITGDIFKDDGIIEENVRNSDVVLPFAGVAKPAYYLSRPLWTFELDFEQNLRVVRMCAEHGKRVIWPSTSEVYGLSGDDVLLEDQSPLTVGPICKMRWIYSCGKQMMDRVLTAYGEERGLPYTIFRPFNWVGPRLDTIEDARCRRARSITQIIYDIVRHGTVTLVGDGSQRRSFTWIGDGIDALLAIIANHGGHADGQIFNIGNPQNNLSIRELTETIIDVMRTHPRFSQYADAVRLETVPAEKFYSSSSYDDMRNRVPSIEKADRLLGWRPATSVRYAVRMTLDAFPVEEALKNAESPSVN